MTGCRIGRVKLKTGATVIPLRAEARDEIQRMVVEKAAGVAAQFEPNELDGYLVVAWDREGSYARSFHIVGDGFVGKTLLPSWIADIVRRGMVASGDWG